jgi:protein TonB
MKSLYQVVRQGHRYPRAAVRAGLTGRVELALTIDRSGKILNAWVHKSSGIDLLDNAALKSIRRLTQVPAPPSGLPWENKTVLIPMVFDLG